MSDTPLILGLVKFSPRIGLEPPLLGLWKRKASVFRLKNRIFLLSTCSFPPSSQVNSGWDTIAGNPIPLGHGGEDFIQGNESESGYAVGHAVGQHQLVSVYERAAGVENVGYVTFPLDAFRAHQRFAQA